MKPKKQNKEIRFFSDSSKVLQEQTIHPDKNGIFDLSFLVPTGDLAKDKDHWKTLFSQDATLIDREFTGGKGRLHCCAFFFDGMVKSDIIYDSIIRPIVTCVRGEWFCASDVCSEILFAADAKTESDPAKLTESLLSGDTLLFIDGFREAIIVSSKGFPQRSVEEPGGETALLGPREGFTESLLMNVAMLRRKLKTPDLKIVSRTFGSRSNTKAFLCYLDSLIDPSVLDELQRRLDKVCIDGVLDVNYLLEIIGDGKYTLFRTIGTTEKPDSVAAKLLEGRIALILDGTPVVLTVPYLFVENFQSQDDYYMNYFFASIGRLIRHFSFFLTISIPAIYVALVAFHKEMISSKLALSIAIARDGVPFPLVVECVLMLAIFEILREASTRMPNNVGQTIGIVGALVVGQAAVEAKFVSAPMLIVVAFAGITGLMSPKLKAPIIACRFSLIFLVSFFGFYGYLFGILFLWMYLLSLRSFGVSYTAYMGALGEQKQKDIYVRAPWWYMRTRPDLLSENAIRQHGKRKEEKM